MRRYVYIGLGGVAGAILRYIVSRAGLPNVLNIPVAVIMINACGTLAIGFILTLFIGLRWNENLRAGVTIGFLGAFTTFSTASRQMFDLLHAGNLWAALAYAAVSILLGFCAAYLGAALGHVIVHKKQKAKEQALSEESGEE